MNLNDCYKIVGVKKNATLDEIKTAYRKKALHIHPDKQANKELANKLFSELNVAYNLLKKHHQNIPKRHVINTHTVADDYFYKNQERMSETTNDPFIKEQFEELRKNISLKKIFQLSKMLYTKASNAVKQPLHSLLDEKMFIYLEPEKIIPNSSFKIQIPEGMSNPGQIIPITLPADFTNGDSICLSKYGREFASIRGDLYVFIYPKKQ